MEKRLKGLIIVFLVTVIAVFEIRAQETYTAQPERVSASIVKSSHVFPNPAIEYVHIRLDEINVSDIKFTVHNLIGNKIEVESEAINEHEFRIKVKDFSAGYYLISVKDQQTNQSGILRFLKR